MTSPMNHGDTVSFFNQRRYFGLNSSAVYFFPQGVMPSFDLQTGRILLADKDRISFSPDGHGGSLEALARSGALANMRERGVQCISYIQVDNPHGRVIDPLFLGLHMSAEDSSGEMSSKMLPKTGPHEKLGNFCKTEGGRSTIIEYSDLPDDLAEQRDENGELRFRAGSIAIHLLSVDFVARITSLDSSTRLPWHRALKKVKYFDHERERIVEPDEPNAVKIEKFVFDALPLCQSSIILETDRIEEFAPIKNLTGVDSAESSRAIQVERHARWLESAGVRVPRDPHGHVDATIEISPLTASESDDLLGLDLPTAIEPVSTFHI
jgi:UDP-N-acetylglucosamine/UDP-N-acetylgalactosamine diphosphorylase